MSDQEIRTIRGTVVRLHYQSPKFCAGKLAPVREDVTRPGEISFAGNVFVRPGEPVVLAGHWEDHKTYGRQFKATARVFQDRLDVAGLAAWLAHHGSAIGIGKAKAEQIASEFGENFAGVLCDNPEQIAILCRVPLDNVRALAESWSEHEEENNVGTRLAAYQLTSAQIHTLYDKFKGSIVPLLEADPYLLMGEIPGFGFDTVDKIAKKLGIPATHPGRLRAGILYALQSKRNDGSTCMDRLDLIEQTLNSLGLDVPNAENLIGSKVDETVRAGQELFAVRQGDREWVALASCWHNEQTIAAFLRTASNPNLGWSDQEVNLAGASLNGIVLDESQQRAIAMACKYRACLITGGAGSGKSTLIASYANLCRDAGLHVVLVAPTGKAARRLEEVTKGEFVASTIHRLLEYRVAGTLREKEDGDGHDGKNYETIKYTGFQRNAKNPISADVLVVDESSMLDSSLAAALIDAIPPKTSVVFVGDHHQLPPVGAGALLRDAITRELMPVTLLGQCHRQAGPLKQNAAAVLLGVVNPTVSLESQSPWIVSSKLHTAADVVRNVEKLFTEILSGSHGYDVIRDVQFLTPKHDLDIGTRALNSLLQRLHQESLGVTVEPTPRDAYRKLYVGDKVIQNKNDYALGIMNGHQGVVVQTNPLVVQFEDREIEIPSSCSGNIGLAYALSVHKTQGSEFPCVVVICHSSHGKFCNRNLLYTAVTRAKTTCIILGDSYGISQAAKNVTANLRCTLLPVLLDTTSVVVSSLSSDAITGD